MLFGLISIAAIAIVGQDVEPKRKKKPTKRRRR